MEVGRERTELELVKEAFLKVKAEMFFPPIQFSVNHKLRMPTKVSNGMLQVNPDFLKNSENPHRLLLWHLRHTLSHIHYCPYDAKTAYYLQKIAYSILRDRPLAYMAVSLFSDLQVNCVYLKNKYAETPYHLKDALNRRKPLGLEMLAFSVYKEFFKDLPYKPDDELDILGRLLAEAIRPPKSWVSKVKAIAAVMLRAKVQKCERMLKPPPKDLMGLNFIPLIEDAYPDAIKRISRVLSSIEDEEDAKLFYEIWIKPRINGEKTRKLLEKVKKAMHKSEEVKEEALAGKTGKTSKGSVGKGHSKIVLPTSAGKALKKLASNLKDLLWRRLWYRARAENALITYLALSGKIKPTWAIASYPEEWYVEDELETLDLEGSLDEGPLIPEVTTIKWHMRAAGKGRELHTGFIPSVLVVLDSSYSMSRMLDKASTAAFIAYLSAKWAGGNTSVINFSTNHLVAGWDEDDDIKELTLSARFRELTIMPSKTIVKLLRDLKEPCFTVIITDGGWQNITEALKDLKRLGSKGHQITIFYIKDWEYVDEVRTLLKTPYITMYRVRNPVKDLEGLVLSESMRIYRGSLEPLVRGSQWEAWSEEVYKRLK